MVKRPREDVHDQPHRSWDFTDWDLYDKEGVLDDSVLASWQKWAAPGGARQLELSGEKGLHDNWHGQGRIVFARPYRFAQLRKLKPGLHWEPTKCSQDNLYLRKDDSRPLINYDGRKQGQRNVFREQYDAILAGSNIRDSLALEGANYQSARSAELLMAYLEPERPPTPREVILVSGPESVPLGPYRVPEPRFWNGYDAHPAIYVNNDILKLPVPYLRLLMGPAPFRVGRGRQALFGTVYISGLTGDERRLLAPLVPSYQPIDLLMRRK